MPGVERKTIIVTENNSDVTTFNNGGRSGTFEFVFDLQAPTDVRYVLRDGHQLILDLKDSSNNDLPDDSEVKWVGQSPVEEDERQIGATRTLRQFNNTNQYDADETFRFDLNKEYEFTEDSHLKLKLDSSTAVDWSNSNIELEIVRVS